MADKQHGKQEESKLNKLKHFFGIGSGRQQASINVGNVQPQGSTEYILKPEVLKDLSLGTPANHRMKTIRELSEIVSTKRLEENAVEVLWLTIQDLLGPRVTCWDDRLLAFRFLQNLIKGQYDQLGIMRAHFFRIIRQNELSEDLPHRLEIFHALTSEGKDLLYFEEETGPFLLDWMKTIVSSSCITKFLPLVINVIKFNAAYLDEDVLSGLVLNTCIIATRTKKEEEVQLCLKLLDTVLCYTFLPSDALHQVIICLCKIVNVEKFSQETWTLMRKLLGTHLGHSGIYTMCCILQDKGNGTNVGLNLMRGAIFFIGMALWSSKKVVSLKHPPAAVLPFFKQALENSQLSGIVAYEVVLSTQRLVNKYGLEQQALAWDLILDLLDMLLSNIESSSSPNPALISNIHDLLTSIETLHEQDHFTGSTERFFSIIETCAHKRPESSILNLVTHKVENVNPTHENWIQNLNHLLDRYFKKEVRTKIRIKVLDTLSHVMRTHGTLYEDELMRQVLLPALGNISTETDSEVLLRAIQLLIEVISQCRSSWCLDLLEIIAKVMGGASNPRQIPEGVDSPLKSHNIDEICLAVQGVVNIFKEKLFQLPSSHAVMAHEVLVDHFRMHFQLPSLIHLGGPARLKILDCLMTLRADCHGKLGLPDANKPSTINYSPFILCTHRSELMEKPSGVVVPSGGTISPHTVSPSPKTAQSRLMLISYAESFSCVRLCLEKDIDWQVLRHVLEHLPLVLRNKSLILALNPEDFGFICTRLCHMVSDRNLSLPEKLINKPQHFTKSDFHEFIFPVLTNLVSYHGILDKSKQRDLVSCLEFGLVSKCALICVRALTVCLLEMKDVMMRQLPSVLLRLSQISATNSMAIPLMEFLSSLIHLSELYSNFVMDQYKSIFAIALPYTNPFRYGHYTVSLAYHVLAMWFLKCRLPFRKGFVSFIVKGLKTNVTRQFEESTPPWIQPFNQDSSGRDRTQSLNEEAMRSAEPGDRKHQAAAASARARFSAGSNQAPKPASPVAQPDETMLTFHRELVETCVDMMARFTFSTCSSLPKRTPVAEFLLKGGQSQSWLLGNSIITITTSGGSEVGRAALCEKCLAVARAASQKAHDRSKAPPSVQPTSGLGGGAQSSRRRHKSAAVKSLSPEACALQAASQDDLQLLKASPSSEFENVPSPPIVEGRPSSGLETRSEKISAVDTVLMGLPGGATTIFGAHLCNCWCTLWAEIHIRRPTGNFSWMMRIQNEQDVAELFPDFSLADISSLFMSAPVQEEEEEAEEEASPRKIDSQHLKEGEYESLLQEHFQPEIGKPQKKESKQETIKESPAEDDASPPTLDEAQMLRKSNSSPELAAQQDAETKDSAVPKTAPLPELKPTPQFELKLPTTAGRKRSGTVPPVSSDDSEPAKSRRAGVYENKLPVVSQLGKDRSQPQHAGINPSFLFLQLFHAHRLEERPLALPDTQAMTRSLKMLDLIYPFETHKIGVIYVGPGQANDEQAILGNVYGSERYMDFLNGLGSLVYLPNCILENTYLGGLDQRGGDGKFAYVWQEEFIQVVFHVATLMPNQKGDSNYTSKKLHIGNDYVTIVYNDSGEEHKIGSMKGQFNYVNIIVNPLDHGMNTVTVQTKKDVEEIIGHTDTKIISDAQLGILLRQMALHADLASTIMQKQKSNPRDPYASNWLERLRQIKRIRSKVIQETAKGTEGQGQSPAAAKQPPTTPVAEDFTDFV